MIAAALVNQGSGGTVDLSAYATLNYVNTQLTLYVKQANLATTLEPYDQATLRVNKLWSYLVMASQPDGTSLNGDFVNTSLSSLRTDVDALKATSGTGVDLTAYYTKT